MKPAAEKFQTNPMAVEVPHRKPVDRVAARVTGVGFKYQPDKKVNQNYSRTPPPMLPVPKNAKDLTGVRFGRFVVKGYVGSSKKNGARWAVRCDCGSYYIRRSAVIANKNNEYACCDLCQHLVYLKRHGQFLSIGKNIDPKDA